MTDAERIEIERLAGERLERTPCPLSKPEHFGFFAERTPEGLVQMPVILRLDDVRFRLAANMMRMYYAKFTEDNADTRLINRVCLAIMAKGAVRHLAWKLALDYHQALRVQFGPDYNLDNYTVVVMREDEATPEAVEALIERHNDINSGKLH